MKVKELLQLLSGADPEAQVILQKDGAGNDYSPLDAVDTQAVYLPKTTWSGEVYRSAWTAAEADMSEEDWRELLSGPRSVVLGPVN